MPHVYVSTYAKYNSGSLKGEWVDLDDHDKYTFREYIKELHADEDDPEFMLQDWENVPEALVKESGIDPRMWDWLELDDYDRDVVQAFLDEEDSSAQIDYILEHYGGTYLDPVDWAQTYLEEVGEVPEGLRGYINYERYARDAGYDGMTFIECSEGVHVFHP
ncbi:MAG: antirestriction protein ArdA [FCB group bacterium]|jgi:antirestriction protein|nr:antirestriction protein ArdA [FCB group bacterium]